ncbi:hypothetical protein N1851_021654 [Merluccius polli]|uniref:Uncharacterized protein n=1 Tax=Merluccius polli TaxID=89951 RepID=A0AA47MJP3_MERPO|nr:hypothetical protein N1851_021654 [Merluccius polli]
MPGCLEHTGVVTQLIREARENKGNLSLVQLTLTKHHIPSGIRDLIADYYSNFRMWVSSGAIQCWHKVEIGIITGCAISVTRFSLAMNMLTKSAECRGPRTNSSQWQPPIRAFMDDLTNQSHAAQKAGGVGRVRFTPAKTSAMVLRKGKVEDKFRFNIAGTAIPTEASQELRSDFDSRDLREVGQLPPREMAGAAKEPEPLHSKKHHTLKQGSRGQRKLFRRQRQACVTTRGW